MEFEGTVYKILPVTKGTSARGEWQRQDVVFEMNEGSFTRKICVTFFNKPEDVADRLHIICTTLDGLVQIKESK